MNEIECQICHTENFDPGLGLCKKCGYVESCCEGATGEEYEVFSTMA